MLIRMRFEFRVRLRVRVRFRVRLAGRLEELAKETINKAKLTSNISSVIICQDCRENIFFHFFILNKKVYWIAMTASDSFGTVKTDLGIEISDFRKITDL